MTLSETKKRIRRDTEAARAALAREAPDAGARIARQFLASIALPPHAVLGGYIATRSEADPAPLLQHFRKLGHSILLPRVAARNAPLAFHIWRADAEPAIGAFGLKDAAPEWPLATPDVVLVPLLAFDAAGYRLGYGGGFYDHSLHAMRRSGAAVLAVGIAYAGQERQFPHDAHDEKLDWIVTERFARRFEGQ
jgi:5-formyltetrahydrofolate cyclo-ligase